MQNLPACTCDDHPRKVDPACPLTLHFTAAATAEIAHRLSARYNEQADAFPTMHNDIPRALYIRRNLGRAPYTLPDGTPRLSAYARTVTA